MRTDSLANLKELWKLRHQSESSMFDTSQLEADFLNFSQYTGEKKLIVKKPKMYELEGEELMQYAAAMSHCGISSEVPERVDISGAFDCKSLKDEIVLLSNNQLNADHCFSARAYLNPILEKVYSDGARLIENFGIHESIAGKISCKRGELDLKELKLFPEKFSSGPYTLRAELDTPTKTISRMKELEGVIAEFEKDAKRNILDHEKLKDVTAKAVGLRKLLGSLSRYSVESQVFEAEADSYSSISGDNTSFYLYSEKQNKNILVFFGENPVEGVEIKDLLVLNGTEYQHTLAKLVETEIFEPSMAVLEQRIKDLAELYENACRAEGKSLNKEHLNFQWLREELENARTYFNEIINPDMRKDYAKRLAPELLEFLVCPSSDDPIVHELLPRLSWNASIRQYSNTNQFISKFEGAAEENRKEMLKTVVSNLAFKNQQNNDVNVWLYSNYKQFCTEQGIEFDVQ